MTSKGVFAIIGVIALGAAAYFALVPVTTDVSMSMLPDIPILDLQVRIGSKLGVTVGPDGSLESVDCGSPARPTEVTVEPPGNPLEEFVSDLVDGARRVEHRIEEACEVALRPHRRDAVVAGLAAGGSFLLAMFAAAGQRSSRRREQAGERRARPAPLTAPQPAVPASRPPGPPAAKAVPPTIPPPSPASGMTARPRRPVVIGVVVGAAVSVVAGIAWAASRGSERMSEELVLASPSTLEDPRLAVERRCIQETAAAADGLFDMATVASAADLDTSLNRDGDSSWRQYAVDLQALDVGSCPADFQSAFIEYTTAWREYGDAWLDATDGLIKDGMSDDDHQRYATRVNQTRTLVEAVAREHGVAINALPYGR